MAARIEDVVEEAGVVVATVSGVTSNRGAVSERTRNKVWSVIQEPDYHPSQIARDLQSQKTGTVGVIVSDIGHDFFVREVRYLEGALCERGYKTTLRNAVYQKNLERDYIHMLQCNRIDGIILVNYTPKSKVYEGLSLPLISLDRYPGKNIPVVTSDHYQGGILTGNVLAENRCKYVVQICGDVRIVKPSDDRHVAVEAVLKKTEIRCERVGIPMNVFEYGDYKELVSDLFDQYPGADDIFCVGNIVRVVLQEAAKHGIPVPEELRVTRYDRSDASRMTIPVLTMVGQQMEPLARQAVDILMEQIEGDKAIGVYKVPVLLVKGGSAI